MLYIRNIIYHNLAHDNALEFNLIKIRLLQSSKLPLSIRYICARSFGLQLQNCCPFLGINILPISFFHSVSYLTSQSSLYLMSYLPLSNELPPFVITRLLKPEVFLQDIVQLLLTLLSDEDALCRGDTPTTRQTVIQRDLRLLQLLLFTALCNKYCQCH